MPSIWYDIEAGNILKLNHHASQLLAYKQGKECNRYNISILRSWREVPIW